MAVVLFSFVVTLRDPVPPSVNKMYASGRGGQRFLTKEGAAFKGAMTRAVVTQIAVQPWAQAVDAVYLHKATVHIAISLHMTVFNASWKPGSKTKSGAMQSPYKKQDVLNYGKVVEDAVADGTGIDDSAHFDVHLIKVPGPPLVEVFYEVVR